MENRKESDSSQRALVLTLAATAAAALLCGFLLFRIPGDGKNAVLFGLSKERLLMIAVFAILFLLNIPAIIQRKKVRKFLTGKPGYLSAFRRADVVFLFLLLMPEYRFGKAAAYYIRLRPFILWAFLAALFLSLYLHYEKDRFLSVRSTFRNLSASKTFLLTTAAVLIAGVLFVEISGLGKTPEKALWNKNGIPLQSIQLFILTAVFALLNKAGLFSRPFAGKRTLNFFIIWAFSAVLWSFVPLIHNFFAPGPNPPEMQMFPYSDAVTYDSAAQTALNGWKFNFGGIVLKPGVTFVAFLSHLLTGNDFNRSMMVQSALYAVLPAVIYLFGTAIGGTCCGWIAAVLSMLKEWNALSSSRAMLTINSRLIMSEFLIQIVFAAFCYGIFRWLKKDGKELPCAALSGGSLAIGIFTRYNMLAFIPAALLLLAVSYRKAWKALRKPLFVFLLTILAVSAPMLFRTFSTSANMFIEFARTIREVLIEQRFKGNEADSQEAADPEIDWLSSGTEEDDFNTSQITQNKQDINSIKELAVIPSMINHGLHNIITSVLTLPMDLTFHDLEHLYTQEGSGLWRDGWQGDFSVKQWVLLGCWGVLGTIAIGVLLSVHGFAGFSVLYFWVVYSFSIGFSRSSGGRYIVPCNWIPMLLLAYLCAIIFSEGRIEIPETVPAELSEKDRIRLRKKTAVIIISFTAFFFSMILFEAFMPAKEFSAPEEDLAVLQERLSGVSGKTAIDWDLVSEQLESGTMHLTHGITLYPRFYYFRTGEHASGGAFAGKEYSRLSFFGIGKTGRKSFKTEYMIPHTQMIDEFPQDSVFRALSCRNENGYEDILAVTLDTKEGSVITYLRDPLPSFSCPVPEPVCTAIEVCH